MEHTGNTVTKVHSREDDPSIMKIVNMMFFVNEINIHFLVIYNLIFSVAKSECLR